MTIGLLKGLLVCNLTDCLYFVEDLQNGHHYSRNLVNLYTNILLK